MPADKIKKSAEIPCNGAVFGDEESTVMANCFSFRFARFDAPEMAFYANKVCISCDLAGNGTSFGRDMPRKRGARRDLYFL